MVGPDPVAPRHADAENESVIAEGRNPFRRSRSSFDGSSSTNCVQANTMCSRPGLAPGTSSSQIPGPCGRFATPGTVSARGMRA